MNAERRKKLKEVHSHLETASEILSDVIDEEQESLDNTPENLQESGSYQEREDKLDDMRYAYEDISECIRELDDLLV